MKTHWNVGAFVAFVLVLAMGPATASPLADLHDLVGTWKCTYRAGTTTLPYSAVYAYDRDGHILRQTATFAGGGDEEYIAYDTQHHAWSVVVFDDQGSTTVMRGSGNNPKHFRYRSTYPDTSIGVAFDRISSSEYVLHGSVRMGGKTIASVDTCSR